MDVVILNILFGCLRKIVVELFTHYH